MDVAVLVSPSAGRGRATALGDEVLDELRAAGLTTDVLPATTGAEAERQAADPVATGSARWSPSEATAPCTPACRPWAGRRPRWP
jgi:hypothetical protein